MKKFLLVLFFNLFVVTLFAAPKREFIHREAEKVYFPVGKSQLNWDFGNNDIALQSMVSSMLNHALDSTIQLKTILIQGNASPEGSIGLNKKISTLRAKTMYEYLSKELQIGDSLVVVYAMGRSWRRLIQMVEKDLNTPDRADLLPLLRDIAYEADFGVKPNIDHVVRLQNFKGGKAYKYMYRNHFPKLRSTYVCFEYVTDNPAFRRKYSDDLDWLATSDTLYMDTLTSDRVPTQVYDIDVYNVDVDVYDVDINVNVEAPTSETYVSIRTNLLFDLASVWNVGVDIHLGKNISMFGDWNVAWIDLKQKYFSWRIYGGDLGFKFWFGRAAKEKPLTGHHIGIYGQILNYDLNFANILDNGNLGRITKDWSYGGGISYGYSVPISRKLNLDFGLSVGYLYSLYDEYLPVEMPDRIHYVWQATKRNHYIGLTNFDFTLVWQLGVDNYNRKFDKNRRKKSSLKIRDEIVIGGDTIVDDVKNKIETQIENTIEGGAEQ